MPGDDAFAATLGSSFCFLRLHNIRGPSEVTSFTFCLPEEETGSGTVFSMRDRDVRRTYSYGQLWRSGTLVKAKWSCQHGSHNNLQISLEIHHSANTGWTISESRVLVSQNMCILL